VDSPQLLVEQEWLTREVEINSTLHTELKKHYELAKLEEIKNLTIVSVLDPARPPVLKEGPKRKTNTIIMFLSSFVLLGSFHVVRSIYGNQIIAFVATIRNVQKSNVPNPHLLVSARIISLSCLFLLVVCVNSSTEAYGVRL